MGLEGIDASGKTVHTVPILKELARLGHPTQTLIFPNNRTPLGRLLKSQIQFGKPLDATRVVLSSSLGNRAMVNPNSGGRDCCGLRTALCGQVWCFHVQVIQNCQ